MIKKISGILAVLLLFFAAAKWSPSYALKKRIRAPKATYATARLSRGTNSVVVSFNAKSNIQKFSYVLSYTANGIPQGVVGTFIPSGAGSESRDLYFGTCSHGVCTPHYGITGASLTITTTLTGGATYIKRFVLKNV